jgi:hypothetical protein
LLVSYADLCYSGTRELEFEVGTIRTLLAMQDQLENSCGRDALVGSHLAAIDNKIKRLNELQSPLLGAGISIASPNYHVFVML